MELSGRGMDMEVGMSPSRLVSGFSTKHKLSMKSTVRAVRLLYSQVLHSWTLLLGTKRASTLGCDKPSAPHWLPIGGAYGVHLCLCFMKFSRCFSFSFTEKH